MNKLGNLRQTWLILLITVIALISCSKIEEVHVWEVVELTFKAEELYVNPYTDVDFWVELTGPGFEKSIEGFWDGGQVFKVRVLATLPGAWSWTSHSSVGDGGLEGKSGAFMATEWTGQELEVNPNRRGTIRATAKGRALEYADGTPFLLIADTHWSAATWRYPWRQCENYSDSESNSGAEKGWSFQEMILHLKEKGYNSIGFISCFPNWAYDQYPADLEDDAGVRIRKPWPKPGHAGKSIDMHDEEGNRAFFFPGRSKGKEDAAANFDSINPAYWRSLDRKMEFMSDQGFVPYMESIRRDHLHTWWTYHDFNTSFIHFLKYLRARYGVYNQIFALLHGDYFGDVAIDPIDEACDLYYETYGPMPFGQPTTAMANKSSYFYFGHRDDSPWLELHSSGNTTRNHLIYKWIEEQFRLPDPVPVFNNEPYYVGHKNPGGEIAGGNPPDDPARDSYYGRAQAYGSILSGGLAGHVYGSTSWMGITGGEPDMGAKSIRWWLPFAYPAFSQMQYVKDFFLSEGDQYRNLDLASGDLIPRISKGALENGLDGWAFMMKTRENDMAMLYFENGCELPVLKNMHPSSAYHSAWFNPRKGEWIENADLVSDEKGSINLAGFPSGNSISQNDWALKLIRAK